MISWGRRRLSPYGPSHAARAGLIAAALAAVCAGGGLAPTIERPKESIIAGEAPRAIQETLDQHVDAIARRDAFIYERTLDRRDPTFVGCMRDLFGLGDVRVVALRPARVVGLEQVSPSLVRVGVEQRDGVATMYMRRLTVIQLLTRPPIDIRHVFHVWYVSQPEGGELGPPRTLTQGDVTLVYSEPDEPLAGPLLREAAAARNTAIARVPGSRAGLRIRLVAEREHATALTCRREAEYDPVTDELLIYRYWTDANGQPSDASRVTIREGVLKALGSR